jgi:hypothetical protein
MQWQTKAEAKAKVRGKRLSGPARGESNVRWSVVGGRWSVVERRMFVFKHLLRALPALACFVVYAQTGLCATAPVI